MVETVPHRTLKVLSQPFTLGKSCPGFTNCVATKNQETVNQDYLGVGYCVWTTFSDVTAFIFQTEFIHCSFNSINRKVI